MNKPTQIISDARLQTQIKVAEAEKNSELVLLLLELKQYRVVEKIESSGMVQA